MRSRVTHLLLLLILAASSFFAGSAVAQNPDPADYEPVLVPAFFFGDGAHGSRWESYATVFNDGETEGTFARPVLNGDPVCDAICGCGVRSEILPGETNQICPSIAHFAGLLVYPERSSADALHYQLFVRDRSRDRASAGTEVPVVRERDLESRIVLLDVSVSESFRSTLRVYDALGRGGMQVRMEIFDHGTDGKPLVDETLTLVQYVQYFAPEPFPANPSIAIVDLREALKPRDRGPDDVVGPSDSPTRVRIELTPIGPLERFWAFVTMTSDETNEVTTVTP